MNMRSFYFLWGGQSLALFGDVFYIIAIITLVYETTQIVTSTALIPFFITSARLISGFIAPIVMDRYRLHSILVYGQSAKSALLLMMCLFSPYFLSPSKIYTIFIFVFVISFLDGWTTPARNAFVPRLVEADGLLKANSLLSTTDQTIQLVGWALGALLVAFIGGQYALWLTFGLFVLSTASVLWIQDRTVERRESGPTLSKWHSLSEGWLIIWRTPPLRLITIMDTVEGIGNSVWAAALLLVFVKEVLHRGEQWWGYINASFCTGTILGGLFVLAISKWMNRRLSLSVILGSVLFGLFTLLFAMVSMPFVALLLCILMGPAFQLRDIAQRTIFQQSVSTLMLPKVFSVQGTIQNATFGLSVMIMAYLSDLFGIRIVFVTSACLYGLSALFAISNRRMLSRKPEPAVINSST